MLDFSNAKIDSHTTIGRPYPYKDSSLQSHIFGPNLYFSDSFKNLFENGEEGMKGYIQKTLEGKKGEAIGVEFGGPATNLFRSFDKGFFKRSIGVTLVDHRKDSRKKPYPSNSPLVILNENIINDNHDVLEGDIFKQETYENLSKRLNGEKVDFIMERMEGGLRMVPSDPYTMGKILENWYELLNEGGIMFVQSPVVFNNLLEKWVDKIKSEFGNVIEVKYKKGTEDFTPACSAFRLRKLPGAPSKLPLLDISTVKETQMRNSMFN